MCAVHRRAQCPTGPACPARRSPAAFLPLMIRAVGTGRGLTGAMAVTGGDESLNAK